MKTITITHCPGLYRIEFCDHYASDFRILMIPDGSKKVMDGILSEAKKQGYDTTQLVWVEQNAPMCFWYRD